jgi:broad specificity phosphatase PhoE
VRGQEQADGLLVTLGGYPVTRILSSPTVRCHQTVVPLSQERAVPIEVVAALDVDAPVEGCSS